MTKLLRFTHFPALRLILVRMTSLLKHFKIAMDLTVNDTVSASTHSQHALLIDRLMFLSLKRIMVLKHLFNDRLLIEEEASTKFCLLLLDMLKAEGRKDVCLLLLIRCSRKTSRIIQNKNMMSCFLIRFDSLHLTYCDID